MRSVSSSCQRTRPCGAATSVHPLPHQSRARLNRHGNREQTRTIYHGLIGDKLNRRPWGHKTILNEVDQKTPHWVSVKYEKDRYAQYLKQAQADIGGLFSDGEKRNLLGRRAGESGAGGSTSSSSSSSSSSLSASTTDLEQQFHDEQVDPDAHQQQASFGSSSTNLSQKQRSWATERERRVRVNDALRMYRALRPDAPPFYEEDAMLRLKAAVNKSVKEHMDLEKGVDVTGTSGGGGGEILPPFLSGSPSIASSTSDSGEAAAANSTTALAVSSGSESDRSSSSSAASREKLMRIASDPQEAFLPSLDAPSYSLALRALTSSLADDLELIYVKLLLPQVAGAKEKSGGQAAAPVAPGSDSSEASATAAAAQDSAGSPPADEGDEVDHPGSSASSEEHKTLSEQLDLLHSLHENADGSSASLFGEEEDEATRAAMKWRSRELDELKALRTDPDRFQKLVFRLLNFFQLPKDPHRVEEFIGMYWDRCLKALIGPQTPLNLSKDDCCAFLQGHLDRVVANRRNNAHRIKAHGGGGCGSTSEQQDSALTSGFYSFAEDFLYDNSPLPSKLVDERNVVADFPLDEMGGLLEGVLELLFNTGRAGGGSATEEEENFHGPAETESQAILADVCNQFQDFVHALEKIGLRTWLKSADIMKEMDMKFPYAAEDDARVGGAPRLSHHQDHEHINTASPTTLRSADFMLRCANRGKTNLLEFDACDPYKLMNDLPTVSFEEELGQCPRNEMVMEDLELRTMLMNFAGPRRQKPEPTGQAALSPASSSGEVVVEQPAGKEDHDRHQGDFSAPSQQLHNNLLKKHAATIAEVLEAEKEFSSKPGPLEYDQEREGWNWKIPDGVIFDPVKKCYVKQQRGVDPLLKLDSFRQVELELRRMGAMCAAGRLFYWRSTVLVGNGQGTYGFGTGFGNTGADARKDAATKALQKLEFIDLDEGRLLPTPVRGREYGQYVTISPRAIGRGVQANKKHLPLLYVLGLDNCKFSFRGSQWWSRVRALKRALDGISSRKTLANGTGQRYSLLTAPGDHWVHWPDRWFDNIRESYTAKYKAAKLKRKRILLYKKRGNVIAHAGELKPGWSKTAWMNPIQKWMRKELTTNRFAYNLRAAPRNFLQLANTKKAGSVRG